MRARLSPLTMIGGMVSSTLLTLIVIPAIHGLVKGRGLPSKDAERFADDAEAWEIRLAAE